MGNGGPATAGFMRGDIDAYVAATSDAAILNSRGLATGDYIEANPEVVEGFSRAVVSDPANIEAIREPP